MCVFFGYIRSLIMVAPRRAVKTKRRESRNDDACCNYNAVLLAGIPYN